MLIIILFSGICKVFLGTIIGNLPLVLILIFNRYSPPGHNSANFFTHSKPDILY